MDNNVLLAMDVDKITYEQEQTDLIKFILNERFFNPWLSFNDIENKNNLHDETALEIFITSTCNQSCEYCYLYSNPLLYPAEINKKDTILTNLQILCDWIDSRHFYLPKVELFSGEIWHLNYGLEVLEILYNSLVKNQWTHYLVIPSNCSFVRDESQLAKIQRYINKFNKINVCLSFSISVDGMIIENTSRPLNTHVKKTEEFYERLFLFAQHNNYYFHPMVSANSINQWIENVNWWKSMCDKYNMDFDLVMMMLEVRNNDWTDEKIQSYCSFLDYLIEDYKSRNCNNNNIEFFKQLLGLVPGKMNGYIPYALAEADNFAGCTVSNHLTVRLGDMAICPCHRTAYNKLLYGWFMIENGKIIDIKGNNPQMAIRTLMTNNTYGTLGCDICAYKDICLKGCFGSQFENTGDAFYPIASVCNFFKQKYSFLIHKYIDMGMIDWLDSYTPYYVHFPLIQKYKKIIKEILQNESTQK